MVIVSLLTPPDLYTLIVLSLPVLVVLELTLFVGHLITKYVSGAGCGLV